VNIKTKLIIAVSVVIAVISSLVQIGLLPS